MIKHNLTYEQRRAIIPYRCKGTHCECDSEARLECDRKLFMAEPMPQLDGQAFKADDGKPNWSLLMTRSGCAKALAGVVRVLTFAVAPKPKGKGYVPHSWRQVPEAKERYLSALYRHLHAIETGELIDAESGESHWYHVATNALFLAELHNDQESD